MSPRAVEVALTRGMVALIDESDMPLVSGRRWQAVPGRNTWYARSATSCNGAFVGLRMHRVILSAPAGLEVDHINGNGLDNRRINLRLADRTLQRLNQKIRSDNQSGFTGVYRCKTTGRWAARLDVAGETFWLGRHDTPEEAARAYARRLAEIVRGYEVAS